MHFAEHGWNVVATMRKPSDGAELATGVNVLVTQLDLLDPATIRVAVDAATERFGAIDVLAPATAPTAPSRPPPGTSSGGSSRYVFGLIETIKAVLPGMRARRSGTIVNIASAGGRVTYPFGTLYHGSKWAVEGLSEALHYELAALGIGVKMIEPGGVRTDLFSAEQDEGFVAGMRARSGR